MKIAGSSNWLGFFLFDMKTGITVRSKRYADALKIRPHVPLTGMMTPAEQASLEDSIEIEEKGKWHATEHKLIYLLKNGKDLTLANLRAAPKELPECGGRNINLKEPEDEKLKEAIDVGLRFLRLKNLSVS